MSGHSGRTSGGAIRLVYQDGPVSGLTDGQLLERFGRRRDDAAEAAFEAIVTRHGPMVLRVCRSIAGDEHDARDAFQATFLVLARRGRSLWVRDSIGPWLHRVAGRAASRVRRDAARRRVVERAAAEARVASFNPAPDDGRSALLHEEIDRLPERFRAAVVLCDLEGLSLAEAARSLGCAVGTVGSRLTRARARLRDRLTRRGLDTRGGPAAAFPAWLAAGPALPIPPDLAHATPVAAAGFRSIGAPAWTPAALLAHEVIRAMTISRIGKLAVLLLAMGASSTGVVALVAAAGPTPQAPGDVPRARPGPAADVAATEVRPGDLRILVRGRGSVEASRAEDVYAQIDLPTTIVSVLPEGTRVTKGQVVGELDATDLKRRRGLQAGVAATAAAALEQGRRAVAEAEAARKDADDVARDERAVAREEVDFAKAEVTRAEARRDRTRGVKGRVVGLLEGQGGPKSPADLTAVLDLDDRLDAAEAALGRARIALQSAWVKAKDVDRDAARRAYRLGLAIEEARAEVLKRQAALDQERAREAVLDRMIAACTLVAPIDGLLTHANDPNRMQPYLTIAPGSTVRDRQKLFSVVDVDGPMIVNAKIPEAWVDRLARDQAARIRVDAFPEEDFNGVVRAIAPLPDPTSLFSQNVKVYTTHIEITRKFGKLRPGMTSAVEVQIAERPGVLSVPVSAVVRYDDAYHVAVTGPDGTHAWRTVELGMGDDTAVEVKAGLKPGDRVVTDPAPLLTDDLRRKIEAARSPGAAKRARGTAKAADAPISPATLEKLQALSPEARARLRGDAPTRAAILKELGFDEAEIRALEALRPRTGR